MDLVFFDFAKAFDTVVHVLLLQKLASLGVCQQLLFWIECFLRRSIRVRVAGACSQQRLVTSGVPQGSVLGPILFIIYVNYAIEGLNSKVKIFADDIKMYLSYTSDDDVSAGDVLQSDIDKLVLVSSSWGLSLNVSKCVCVRFASRSYTGAHDGPSPYTISGDPIQFTGAHSDLGVVVDRDLKFHGHIRKKANICNALTTNLLSSTLCREPQFIMSMYTSLIRPQLEYGCTLWNTGYLGDMRTLERIQRRWTRSVAGLENVPYSQRLTTLDLFSVQGRLLRADLILAWKIFNAQCAISPDQVFVRDSSSNRGHRFKLFLPRANRDLRRRFYTIRVVQPWNSLSAETVNADTLGKFKSLLRRDLGQKLYDYLD